MSKMESQPHSRLHRLMRRHEVAVASSLPGAAADFIYNSSEKQIDKARSAPLNFPLSNSYGANYYGANYYEADSYNCTSRTQAGSPRKGLPCETFYCSLYCSLPSVAYYALPLFLPLNHRLLIA
jgi:hypothetical protein